MMAEKMDMNEFHLLDESERNDVPFQVIYPHLGLQARLITFGDLQSSCLQIPDESARTYWDKLHEFSLNQCQHLFEFGNCPLRADCDVSRNA